MKKIYSIIFIILLSTILFSGTDGTIRGTVRDINGEPLPGVQVYIEALGQGATTDADGTYIILNIQEYNPNADLNGDDEINIADIILLVEWILEQL